MLLEETQVRRKRRRPARSRASGQSSRPSFGCLPTVITCHTMRARMAQIHRIKSLVRGMVPVHAAERSLDTVVRAVSASVLPVWVDFTSLKGLPCDNGSEE